MLLQQNLDFNAYNVSMAWTIWHGYKRLHFRQRLLSVGATVSFISCSVSALNFIILLADIHTNTDQNAGHTAYKIINMLKEAS